MENTNKTILITRPNCDCVTRYFYYWAKGPIQKAKDKMMGILDLKVERANEKDFKRAMKKNPSLVVFNGDDNLKFFGLNDDEGAFKSKIVCDFPSRARILGIKNIGTGAKAYIGFDDNFIFCCYPGRTYDPLEDKLAHFFLDSPSIIVSSLLDGLSVDESMNKAKEFLKESIEEVKYSECEFIAPFLLWDMRHLKLIGDKNARI